MKSNRLSFSATQYNAWSFSLLFTNSSYLRDCTKRKVVDKEKVQLGGQKIATSMTTINSRKMTNIYIPVYISQKAKV